MLGRLGGRVGGLARRRCSELVNTCIDGYRPTSSFGQYLRPGSLSRVSFSSASTDGRLIACCVLERLPVVIPDPPEWEVAYTKFRLDRMRETHKIYASDWTETRDRAQADDEDIDKLMWQPAPRITEADEKKDMRSLRRKLDARLFLLVKDQTNEWSFPQVAHTDPETMRQAAERALKVTVGESIETYFVGNAPMGHYVHQEAGSQGPASEKLFFHKAQILGGSLQLGKYSDFAWVAKGELGEYLKDTQLVDLCKKMLGD